MNEKAANVFNTFHQSHILDDSSISLVIYGFVADDVFMSSYHAKSCDFVNKICMFLLCIVPLEEMVLAINNKLREQPQTVQWIS